MQTFLPLPDFDASARVLDWRRLGKQRVEATQLLNALEGRSTGWVNHPAARMWRGHLRALRCYRDAMIQEWMRRGYRNTLELHRESWDNTVVEVPSWFGNEAFHASHRSNLLRKSYDWYFRWGWRESIDLPYIWPA